MVFIMIFSENNHVYSPFWLGCRRKQSIPLGPELTWN